MPILHTALPITLWHVADFHQRGVLFGHPPRVIWVRVDDASMAKIEAMLRRRRTSDVSAFSSDPEGALLILY